MDHSAHIVMYYESLCTVYTDAAAIGILVAHIAEFYLERWWSDWAAAGEARTTEGE